MDSRWERYRAREVVDHESNRHLALAMGLLINGGRDCPFFKMGRHLREEIRRYQLDFSGKAACAEGTANGKTVHCIHVESSKRWIIAEKIKRLLKTLLLVLVSLDDTGDLATRAVPRKRFRKPIGFFAMVFRIQHTGNHRHLGARPHKLPHQLTCQPSIQPRFHTNDT